MSSQNQPQPINSIDQFLTQMGVKTRFYDLGRRITKLRQGDFQAFEQGSKPYPEPYLHHAWIGLVFGDLVPSDAKSSGAKSAASLSVWCLRFPLDEQGKLIPAARDEFLQMLLMAVGSNLDAANQGKQLQAVLEGNPYVFTLPPEKQAAFHAHINHSLQLPPSQFFEPAKAYLQSVVDQSSNNQNNSNWASIGLQGLADIAVRWNDKAIAPLLAKTLTHLPEEPFNALCQCLEHETIDARLAGTLIKRLESVLKNTPLTDTEAPLIASAIRGCSNSVATGLRQQALEKVLQHDIASNTEILAALATRCTDDLTAACLTLPFLEQLAQHSQDTFNRIMADLLFQPALRQYFLTAFRTPERSEALSRAIGALLNPAD